MNVSPDKLSEVFKNKMVNLIVKASEDMKEGAEARCPVDTGGLKD